MVDQVVNIFGQLSDFLGGFSNIFGGLKSVIEVILKWVGMGGK